MQEARLKELLEALAEGRTTAAAALEALRTLPFAGAAEVLADTHRWVRQGFPEAVFAEGKSPVQVVEAMTLLTTHQGAALATRVGEETAAALRSRFPEGQYHAQARLFAVGGGPSKNGSEPVGVVCAGTSDLPVAEEVAVVLEFSGMTVRRITDVGIAGLHRLLARLDDLRACSVLIVVAGMEGALPGVIGGLVACPVIAVPTSVGYGANFKGLSALLTMLNTCAAGVTVVNIDNGYGAAVAALRILKRKEPPKLAG